MGADGSHSGNIRVKINLYRSARNSCIYSSQLSLLKLAEVVLGAREKKCWEQGHLENWSWETELWFALWVSTQEHAGVVNCCILLASKKVAWNLQNNHKRHDSKNRKLRERQKVLLKGPDKIPLQNDGIIGKALVGTWRLVTWLFWF